MPLEDTDPRLEAIIIEVKSREVSHISGYVPRADVLLVAEIERLRGRIAHADRLAEDAKALYQAILFTDFPDGFDFIFNRNRQVGIALAAYRKEGE